MKKLISMILVLCMACMLAHAMAEDITGTWYLNELIADGATVNPADAGIGWTLVFNEDGTLINTMDASGESNVAEGTWSMEGDSITMTFADNPQTAEIADGKIKMSIDEQVFVFGREAPTATVKPAAVAAESEDAFLGDWEISGIEMMGTYLTKAMFSIAQMDFYTVNLSITPGKVAVTQRVSPQSEEETTEYDSTFVNGKLTIPFDLGISPETAEALGIDLSVFADGATTIELSDEGGLIYITSLGEFTITVFLLPAAAAEAPAA